MSMRILLVAAGFSFVGVNVAFADEIPTIEEVNANPSKFNKQTQ
jgi:hypothetical protein